MSQPVGRRDTRARHFPRKGRQLSKTRAEQKYWGLWYDGFWISHLDGFGYNGLGDGIAPAIFPLARASPEPFARTGRASSCGASMAQIFHPSTNTISKVSIFGAVFILAAFLVASAAISRSRTSHRPTLCVSSQCHSATSIMSVGLASIAAIAIPAVEESRVCRHATDQNLYELPLPNLGRQPPCSSLFARACAPTTRSPGFESMTCPILSISTTASTVQRGRLCELPWASRSDAVDVAGAFARYGMVPGVSP